MVAPTKHLVLVAVLAMLFAVLMGMWIGAG
jgi:hypothetical protein